MAGQYEINAGISFRVTSASVKPVVDSLQKTLSSTPVNIPVTLKVTSSLKADEIVRQNSAFRSLSRTLEGLGSSALKGSAGLDRLNASLVSIQSSFAGFANSTNVLKGVPAQINQATKALNKAGTAAKENEKHLLTFGETVGISARRFIAFSVAAGTLYTLTSAISDATKEAFKFDQELVRLKQVGGDSPQVIKSIADEVTRLSTTLGANSSDLIKSAVTLRQAGLSARETKQALDALAKTTLSPTFDNLSNTTEGVIAILAQFKKGTGELEKQLGSLSKVSADYPVESSDLVDAIRKMGGAFVAAGGNLNELLAIFTSVRATTRESSETIATGLRTVTSRLQSSEVTNKLREYGITLYDTNQQFIGVYKSVEKLHKALSALPATDKRFADIVNILGGTRQSSRIIPLIQQQPLAEKVLKTAIKGEGILDKDALIAQEAFITQLNKLKETFLDLFRVISTDSSVRVFLQGTTSLLTSFTSALKELRPLVPIFLAFAGVKAFQSLKGFPGNFAKGYGSLKGYASGGLVTGPAGRDKVPAMLTAGEYVLPKGFAQGGSLTAYRGINKNELRVLSKGKSYTGPTGQIYISNSDSVAKHYAAVNSLEKPGYLLNLNVDKTPKRKSIGYAETIPSLKAKDVQTIQKIMIGPDDEYLYGKERNAKDFLKRYRSFTKRASGGNIKQFQGLFNKIGVPVDVSKFVRKINYNKNFVPGYSNGVYRDYNNSITLRKKDKYSAQFHEFGHALQEGFNKTKDGQLESGSFKQVSDLFSVINTGKGSLFSDVSSPKYKDTLDKEHFANAFSAYSLNKGIKSGTFNPHGDISSIASHANFPQIEKLIDDILSSAQTLPVRDNSYLKNNKVFRQKIADRLNKLHKSKLDELKPRDLSEISGMKGWTTLGSGGIVPTLNTGIHEGTDSVPTLLTPGEFVLSVADVQRMGGTSAVDRMRKQASGGNVLKDSRRLEQLGNKYGFKQAIALLKEQNYYNKKKILPSGIAVVSGAKAYNKYKMMSHKTSLKEIIDNERLRRVGIVPETIYVDKDRHSFVNSIVRNTGSFEHRVLGGFIGGKKYIKNRDDKGRFKKPETIYEPPSIGSINQRQLSGPVQEEQLQLPGFSQSQQLQLTKQLTKEDIVNNTKRNLYRLRKPADPLYGVMNKNRQYRTQPPYPEDLINAGLFNKPGPVGQQFLPGFEPPPTAPINVPTRQGSLFSHLPPGSNSRISPLAQPGFLPGLGPPIQASANKVQGNLAGQAIRNKEAAQAHFGITQVGVPAVEKSQPIIKKSFNGLVNFFKSANKGVADVSQAAEQTTTGKPGRFGLKGKVALGALAVGAPILADQLSKSTGSASRSASGFSGAISGGTTGAFLGSVAGTPGSVVGGVLGALAGLVGGLSSFDEELQKVNLDKFSKQLEESSTKLNAFTGEFKTPQSKQQYQESIKKLSLTPEEQARENNKGLNSLANVGVALTPGLNIASALGGYDEANKLNKGDSSKTLGDIGKNIFAFVDSVKEGLGFSQADSHGDSSRKEQLLKNDEERARNAPLVDKISSDVRRVQEANAGLPQEAINRKLQPFFQALNGLGSAGTLAVQSLKEEGSLRQKFAQIQTQANQAFELTITELESFAKQLHNAGEQFDERSSYNDLGSNALRGQLSSTPNKLNVGNLAPSLTGLGAVAGTLGGPAQVSTPAAQIALFGRSGGGYDKAKEELLKIVEQVGKEDNLKEEDRGIRAAELFKKSGVGGQYNDRIAASASEVLTHTENLSSKIAQGGGRDIVGQILKPVEPIKDVYNQSNESLRKAFSVDRQKSIELKNRQFELDQNKSNLVGARAESLIGLASTANVLNPQSSTLTSQAGQRGKLGLFATRGVSAEERQVFAEEQVKKSAFSVQQETLTGLKGISGTSPEFFKSYIKGEQNKIEENKGNLKRATDTGSVSDVLKFSNAITESEDKIRRYGAAINNIAQSTVGLDSAQKKYSLAVNKYQADLDSRTKDADILTFGSRKEKAQLFQKEAITQQALQLNPQQFSQLPDQVKKIVGERLRETEGQTRSIEQFDKYGRSRGVRDITGGEAIEQFRQPYLNQLQSAPGAQRLARNVVGAGLDVAKEQNIKVKAQEVTNQLSSKDITEQSVKQQASFQQYITDINSSIERQIQAGNQFLSASTELTSALNNFNGELTIKREGKVEVILNGAQVIASMKGDLEKNIFEQVINQLQPMIAKEVANLPAR